MENKALRFNKGKLRYDLIPRNAEMLVAKVYTEGAHKYTLYDVDGTPTYGKEFSYGEAYKYKIIEDGADNWRRGLSWTGTIASVERHIEDFKSGNDFDVELKTHNLANAVWGLMSVLEFYKTHPELDDRKPSYLTKRRIGLDIDDVCSDFVGHWCKYWNCAVPTSWNFDREIVTKFEELKDNRDFWLGIPRKIDPAILKFEPAAYITSRSIPQKWTEHWLDINDFPVAPVYSVGFECSKLEAIKQAKLDIFVDDRYDNFVEITNAGTFTYLMDMPHNQRYDVGHRRIYDLSKL